MYIKQFIFLINFITMNSITFTSMQPFTEHFDNFSPFARASLHYKGNKKLNVRLTLPVAERLNSYSFFRNFRKTLELVVDVCLVSSTPYRNEYLVIP